jgi:hypothetical protein
MLMQEVSAVVDLVLIQLATESNMPFRLLEILVELLHPCRVALLQVLVQLHQHAEVGTRRAPDYKQWLITLEHLPGSLPVGNCVKIKPICEV